MLGLCLFAAFAVSALGAAMASAEGGPEGGTPGFNKCVKATKVGKTYTGEYTEKECKTKASPAKTGKYEVQAVTSGTFEGKSKVTTLTTHTTNGVAVTVICKKDKYRGSIVFENEVVEETIVFEDCLGNGAKTDPCGNAAPETIETDPQEGELVWLNEGKTEAGMLLAGTQFAAFKCGTEEVEVDGFVIGTASLGGKAPTITFAVNGSKEQAHKTFWLLSTLGPFGLYTEPKAGEKVESTLQSVETQKGPAPVS